MNNFINISNKIKQPAQCCIHCGKSYKKKSNLDKHLIICELLQVGKKRNSFIENNQDQQWEDVVINSDKNNNENTLET